MFKTGQWASLNKTGVYKNKYHNPETWFYTIWLLKKISTMKPYTNVNPLTDLGDITPHLTSVDIEEVVTTGSVIKEFCEGFLCDNLDFNPFKDYILDMTAKRNEYKEQGKNILQDMCKKYQTVLMGVVLDALCRMI